MALRNYHRRFASELKELGITVEPEPDHRYKARHGGPVIRERDHVNGNNGVKPSLRYLRECAECGKKFEVSGNELVCTAVGAGLVEREQIARKAIALNSKEPGFGWG
jgi:hypothetical protein